jgi:hypothetical protein
MLRGLAFGLVFATLPALSLRAWNGLEHEKIGTTAFGRACTEARSLYSTSTEAEVANRLGLACRAVGESSPPGSAVFTYSDRAGFWSKMAADHVTSPEQLTESRLGSRVGNRKQMARIAIDNVEHFHPDSFNSWRDFHKKALQKATSASSGSGITLSELFEGALAAESFAQHYLQDSFAAGHMGFNRAASSNAATLSYHRRMSRKGRCVANKDGEAWFTHGDGYLNASDRSGEHVIEASAASYFDFLEAFIGGRPNSSGYQKVEAKFPATFNSDVRTAMDCEYAPGWPTLETVYPPAPGVSAFETFIVSDRSFDPPTGYGIMLGLNVDLRSPIKTGFSESPTRLFGYVGSTLRETGLRDFWVDGGLGIQVGTSARGFLTHELGAGVTVVYSPGDENYPFYYDASGRLFYGVRVEAGPIYIRLQTGAAYSYGHVGSHFSAGLGVVIR